jgi:membrane-bound serine protease (ClpP class)
MCRLRLKSLSRVLTWLLAVGTLGAVFSLSPNSTFAGEPQKPFVYVIQIEDYVINPIMTEYIVESIHASERDGAQALIIELDTPGGLLNSTRTIVKEILNAAVPIVVYIYPSGSRAGSAGVFITLASNIAAMAPSTNIGAAHPVSLNTSPDKMLERLTAPPEKQKEGKGAQESATKKVSKSDKSAEKSVKENEAAKEKPQSESKPEEKSPTEEIQDIMSGKILEDTAAWARAIAHFRARNENWAEAAVRKSASITEEEALKEKVIDYVSKDVRELLKQMDGRDVTLHNEAKKLSTKDAEIRVRPLTGRQKLLNIIIHPNIAYLLMILGFYGLLFEITHPGVGVSGVAGLLCLIVAAYALQLLPVNYAGLLLILLAIILFIAEVKVHSYGLLTLGGLVAMTVGSLMLIRAPQPFIGVSLGIIVPVVAGTAVIFVFLVTLVVRAHAKKATTGNEGMIGAIGVVEVPLAPEGKVFVHGEIWNASSEQPIAKGARVRVKAVKGLFLRVEPLE